MKDIEDEVDNINTSITFPSFENLADSVISSPITN
jgi:hypothetical protein